MLFIGSHVTVAIIIYAVATVDFIIELWFIQGHTIQGLLVGRLTNNKLGKKWRLIQTSYTGICLEELTQTLGEYTDIQAKI